MSQSDELDLSQPSAWLRIHHDGSVLDATSIEETSKAWSRTPHCTVVPLYAAPALLDEVKRLRARLAEIAERNEDDRFEGDTP